jgi:hypothetical protein
MSESEGNFPILRGRRIRNTGEFMDVMNSTAADVIAGRITTKEANAIAREGREILKTIEAVMRAQSLASRL